MTRTVHKYKLELTSEVQRWLMRETYKVVHVGLQNGFIHLWVEVDTDTYNAERRFQIFGTGHNIPDSAVHVGSVMVDPYVWHVYDVT